MKIWGQCKVSGLVRKVARGRGRRGTQCPLPVECLAGSYALHSHCFCHERHWLFSDAHCFLCPLELSCGFYLCSINTETHRVIFQCWLNLGSLWWADWSWAGPVVSVCWALLCLWLCHMLVHSVPALWFALLALAQWFALIQGVRKCSLFLRFFESLLIFL